MLTNAQEQALFESIARGQPRFREWLVEQLSAKHKVLIAANDVELLRITQGEARLLQSLVNRLDQAAKPAV